MDASIDFLIQTEREISLLNQAIALLSWDQETYMPQGAIEGRGEQLAFLSKLAHEKLCSPKVESALASARSSNQEEFVYLARLRRKVEKERRIPPSFVEEYAKQASLSQAAWVEARKKSDYLLFAPHLKRMIDLNKQKAALLDFDLSGEIYPILLDDYEPEGDLSEINRAFSELKHFLVPFIDRIGSSKTAVKEKKVQSNRFVLPLAAQETLSRTTAQSLGFSFDKGRLDISAHPFSTTIGPGDSRITTRYEEKNPYSGLYSVIHETGHALYEQGLPSHWHGTSLGEATSFSIHESQSRFWENRIGRSQAFCKWVYPNIKKSAKGYRNVRIPSLQELYRGATIVSPSLIRVEADEVTYCLHVLLRFELEQEIFSGALSVEELPVRWNKKIEEYFGLKVPQDAVGVLQDVHWSMGAFGYFPTYALGTLYSAQFSHAMEKRFGSLDSLIEKGNFAAILNWHRDEIHSKGSLRFSQELCKEVTGETLNAGYYIQYLKDKYIPRYGL